MDYQLGPGPLQVDQNTIDEKIKGDIGIVENGDVATHAIPSGYYVIWKGDLYVAKTDISSGTTLSSASNGNLTAKTQGLGADVATLNSNLSNVKTQVSIGGSLTSNYVTIHSCLAQYIGALAFYCLEFTPTTAIPAGTEFISGLKVPNGTRNDICVFEGVVVGSTTVNKFTVRDGGKLKNLEAISDTSRRRMTFMYFTV